MARRYTLEIDGKTFTLDVEETDIDAFEVDVGGERYEVRLAGDEDLPEATITPAFGSERMSAVSASAAAAAPLPAAAESPAARPRKPAPRVAAAPPPRRSGSASSGTLAAPMPGVILEVLVKDGDQVARGQEIAVLEAMKMQNVIRSPREGTIAEVCVTAGNAIGHGDAIVRFAEG